MERVAIVKPTQITNLDLGIDMPMYPGQSSSPVVYSSSLLQ